MIRLAWVRTTLSFLVVFYVLDNVVKALEKAGWL